VTRIRSASLPTSEGFGTAEPFSPEMRPSGNGATDGVATDVTALRLEVDRLTDLLINENVGLSVGILMVRTNCGSREALATLVGAAMDAGRSMIEQADLIVGHYESRTGHPVSQGHRWPTPAVVSAT